MTRRAPLAAAILAALIARCAAQDSRPAWREVCVVIRQTGVVRGASEQERRTADVEFPCGWTDDEAMALWRHRPDPVWGCGGFNASSPGKPNC